MRAGIYANSSKDCYATLICISLLISVPPSIYLEYGSSCMFSGTLVFELQLALTYASRMLWMPYEGYTVMEMLLR